MGMLKGLTVISFAVGLLAICARGHRQNASARRIRTILDTDIGTDFDDTWALIYILSNSDVFDLQLVQVSTFNTTQRGQITAKILHDLGRYDVPIAVGENTGPQFIPQYAYAHGYTLQNFASDGGKVYYGVSQMAAIMGTATAEDPVYIVEIAPATSLGSVLSSNRSLARNCITVAMSGSIYVGYDNSSIIDAEYNVKTDIPASEYMYNATWAYPLVTAPLDTTNFDQFFGATYASLLSYNNSNHMYVDVLLANYEAWYQGGGYAYYALLPFNPSNCTSDLYDVQAAWMTRKLAEQIAGGGIDAAPQFPLFTTQTLPLFVNATGYTVVKPGSQMVYTVVGFTTKPYTATNAMGQEIINDIVAPH